MGKITHVNEREQEKSRIRLGWQCPECFGVQVTNRDIGWQCHDCGACWDCKIYG